MIDSGEYTIHFHQILMSVLITWIDIFSINNIGTFLYVTLCLTIVAGVLSSK